MQILSHVLVSPNVTRVACDKNRTQLAAPDTIVMHYTGGGDARSSALYLADPATKASAHVVVARDGQVFQLVPFNTRAWHAGVSALEGRTNVNAFSIGIELANAGRLTRRDDRWFTWFGTEIPSSEVCVVVGKEGITYWHAYTPLQLRVAARICQLLVRFATWWGIPTSPPANKTPVSLSLGKPSGRWWANCASRVEAVKPRRHNARTTPGIRLLCAEFPTFPARSLHVDKR